MRRTSLIVAIVALAIPIPEVAAQRCFESLGTHVRAADPGHRALLRQGFERSATFRQLIADLRASSWLVFVQTGRCPEELAVACLLHFVGTFEDQPYLRVIAGLEQRYPDNVISLLAHELQHAREVAQAGGVWDADAVRDLFRRIGRISVMRPGVVTYETAEAIRVEEAVWRELAQTPRRHCR